VEKTTNSKTIPSNEVHPKAQRRRLTAAYKLGVLAELDAAEHGQKGAILRREGLYTSQVALWRMELAQSKTAAFNKKRGRPPVAHKIGPETEQLRRQIAKLSDKLAQAEAIIEIQKKVSELLGLSLNSSGSDENS
jgi:transposase